MTWSRLERCGSTLAFMMSLPRYGIKAAEEMVVLAIRVSLVVSGWSISLGVGHPWMLGNENVWCHHCNFWSKSVKLEFLHRIDWVRDLIETELLKCLSFVRLQDLVVGKKIVPPATWNATPTPPYTKQYIMQRAKLRRAKPVYNKQVSVVPWLFETNKLCLARLPFRPCSCQNAWVLGCLLTGAALRFILFVFEKFTGNKKTCPFQSVVLGYSKCMPHAPYSSSDRMGRGLANSMAWPRLTVRKMPLRKWFGVSRLKVWKNVPFGCKPASIWVPHPKKIKYNSIGTFFSQAHQYFVMYHSNSHERSANSNIHFSASRCLWKQQ